MIGADGKRRLRAGDEALPGAAPEAQGRTEPLEPPAPREDPKNWIQKIGRRSKKLDHPKNWISPFRALVEIEYHSLFYNERNPVSPEIIFHLKSFFT